MLEQRKNAEKLLPFWCYSLCSWIWEEKNWCKVDGGRTPVE